MYLSSHPWTYTLHASPPVHGLAACVMVCALTCSSPLTSACYEKQHLWLTHGYLLKFEILNPPSCLLHYPEYIWVCVCPFRFYCSSFASCNSKQCSLCCVCGCFQESLLLLENIHWKSIYISRTDALKLSQSCRNPKPALHKRICKLTYFHVHHWDCGFSLLRHGSFLTFRFHGARP